VSATTTKTVIQLNVFNFILPPPVWLYPPRRRKTAVAQGSRRSLDFQ